MVEITTNTQTIELTGEETQVHFSSAFPYFWLRNDGTETALMSLSPNIEEGKDGVIEVLAGSSAGTMHGFEGSRNDLYLLGSGKVQVMGTHAPENPFKEAAKGGDITDLNYAGAATPGGMANSAEKDSRGNIIANTYVKTITKNSDGSLTLFYGNGTSIVIRG